MPQRTTGLDFFSESKESKIPETYVSLKAPLLSSLTKGELRYLNLDFRIRHSSLSLKDN